jgi:nitroreductase
MWCFIGRGLGRARLLLDRHEKTLSDIGLFKAIYSARSIRRLKPDPVSEDLITAVLDAAIRAPSGGNAQSWAFVVVRDADQRHQLGAIYRKASDIAEAIYAALGRPAHRNEQQFARFMASGKYLWDHMGEAPVLLLPCARQPVLPAREAPPHDIGARWDEEVAYAELFAAPASIRLSRTSFSLVEVSASAR